MQQIASGRIPTETSIIKRATERPTERSIVEDIVRGLYSANEAQLHVCVIEYEDRQSVKVVDYEKRFYTRHGVIFRTQFDGDDLRKLGQLGREVGRLKSDGYNIDIEYMQATRTTD